MTGTHEVDDAATEPSPKGIPVVAEALGYVGGALALGAAIALLVRYWAELGPYGHIGIGVLLAVVGLVGGFMLERLEGHAAKRLSQFLLLAGVAGVGIAVGFTVRRLGYLYWRPAAGSTEAIMQSVDEWAWFAGAAAIAVSGGLVWWRRQDSVLQHLAFGGGVAAAALLSLPLMPIEGHAWGAGAVLVAVGLVWGALALKDLLPPRVVGLALSALGIAGGIEMMVVSADPMVRWAMWIGVVVCVALIWAGSHLEELVVLGVGTVGLMLFSGQLVSAYLGFGAGTAIALIAIGFVLLGVGVRLTLKLAPDAARNRRIASEVAGYLGIALAMGGAGILMGQYWNELGVAGHIAVPLVGSAVAYASALVLERSDAKSARRMSQVLYAIGVLAAGVTGAMIAEPITKSVFGEFKYSENAPQPQIDWGSNWMAMVGMLTASAFGGVTWWLRKGALTQAAFMSALIGLVTSVINFLPPDNNRASLIGGATLLVLGTLWVVFGALERITPVRTALVMGSLSTMLGLQMLLWGAGENGSGFHTWAALMGIGYGIAGIIASIYLKRGTLLGFGAVFVIAFSMTLVLERFRGKASGPLMLLAAGLVFIVVAIVVARLAPKMRRTTEPPSAPTSE